MGLFLVVDVICAFYLDVMVIVRAIVMLEIHINYHKDIKEQQYFQVRSILKLLNMKFLVSKSDLIMTL
jgi:hypothetical protein